MANKKVFFGCSMRGGHGVVSREDLAQLPAIIEELGYELASKHQVRKGVLEEENALSPADIHDRDYRWLQASAAGVFEISNPSLGTGGEIADMAHLGKPILCLFKGDKVAVSAYTRGKQGSAFISTPFECHSYETPEEAKNIIAAFLKANT